MASWIFSEPNIVNQAIADTSTTQNHPLGKIVRAKHSTYGSGEFIYLLGVANTAVGSAVSYEPSTYQTALAPVGTNLPRPIAFAMSANGAASYGWYQIGGLAIAAKAVGTSLAAAAAVGVKTIGLVAASGSGKEVQGALVAAVASAKSDVSTVKLMINRPHMQGRVT